MTQWGSCSLGERGYSPIEILRHYYGDSLYINTAEEIAGSSEAPVFTTGEIDAYRASFLNTVRTKSRKSLHIDADLHRRISSLVWAVGRGEVTVAGFVNQVLAHHFEENGGLINAVLEKYYQSLKS